MCTGCVYAVKTVLPSNEYPAFIDWKIWQNRYMILGHNLFMYKHFVTMCGLEIKILYVTEIAKKHTEHCTIKYSSPCIICSSTKLL